MTGCKCEFVHPLIDLIGGDPWQNLGTKEIHQLGVEAAGFPHAIALHRG
jgi:hypothetical protein